MATSPGIATPDRQKHWEDVYTDLAFGQASWHQAEPATSLALLDEPAADRARAVIDVGGGDSRLVDRLVDRGFTDVTVLDVSQAALDRARRRLPPAAPVRWVQADVLHWQPHRHYQVWHDRATFHFLVNDADRDRYLDLVHEAVTAGGLVVLGTFAADGPQQCSGLPIRRYDTHGLAALLGPDFSTISTRTEVHRTPQGAAQPFTWLASRRSTSART